MFAWLLLDLLIFDHAVDGLEEGAGFLCWSGGELHSMPPGRAQVHSRQEVGPWIFRPHGKPQIDKARRGAGGVS